MRYTAIGSLALSAALLLGCGTNTSSPDPKSTDATIEAAKVKRDEYVRDMKKQLDALNMKYDELQGRVAKAGDDARKDLEKKLEAAKVRRDAAAKKLDELKEAGVDRWEKVKEGVGSALDDLKKAFD